MQEKGCVRQPVNYKTKEESGSHADYKLCVVKSDMYLERIFCRVSNRGLEYKQVCFMFPDEENLRKRVYTPTCKL